MDNTISNFIDELLSNYGSLDIFQIIEDCGIEIRYVPFLENPYGQSVNMLGEKIILISETIKESNQKYFVAAHEFYHVTQHTDLSGYYIRDSFSRGKLETEANKFAVEFFINKFIEDNGSSPYSFSELSYMYGIPDEVIQHYI